MCYGVCSNALFLEKVTQDLYCICISQKECIHQRSDRADLLPHQNVITYYDTIGQLAKAVFL